MEIQQHVHTHINENQDSIAMGSAAKGTLIKVYGDLSKPDEFKKKIDNAKTIRDYAQAQLVVGM